MDTVKCNNIKHIGPGMWKLLHSASVRATNHENKIFFLQFLDLFMENISCKVCFEDTKSFLEKFPLINYESVIIDGLDIGYFKWTWELHNHVNKKLGKETVSLTNAYKYFTTVKFDCKACINLEK